MTRYTSWFADAPTAALHYFEGRRASSLARLAAVTRQLRAEIDVHATAARATMAEAAWAEAGWAERYPPTATGTEAV